MNQWTKNPVSVRDRFYQKFIPVTESGCWIWEGSSSGRYGYISHEGHNRLAHRISWELHRGPLPAGMEVCHFCDVEPCVNPAHLFLGTHKENCHDRDRKGRNVNRFGSRHGMARLTEAAVREIRASAETSAALAARFGVHETTVGLARNRVTWKWM